jgi:magnesium transporter
VQVLEAFDRTRVTALIARDERFWLRLHAPKPEVLQEVGDLLGFDHLATEDSLEFGQRPKIDDYPESALLVFYGARMTHGVHTTDKLVVPVEFHFHVTRHGIVSVRHHNADTAQDVRRRVALSDIDTAEEVLYRVLDALVSTWNPALQLIDDEVDRLEDEILEDADTEQRLRLLEIKHSLVTIRQTVSAQRDVLAGRREVLETLPGFHDREGRESLRDIFDRMSMVAQQVDNVRESVSNALDLYVSAVANELNQIIKVLTIVATFFLPMTFVTGFFGQNFGWLVKNVSSPGAFLVLGLGVNAAIVVALWSWFTRAGYIDIREFLVRKRPPRPPRAP